MGAINIASFNHGNILANWSALPYVCQVDTLVMCIDPCDHFEVQGI